MCLFSPTHFFYLTPLLTTIIVRPFLLCSISTSTSVSATFFPPCGVCMLCAYCRLALDDAIRHKQLNISRFSPRVAGENDFLQTVINKVITAKEVNHKGQGRVLRRE